VSNDFWQTIGDFVAAEMRGAEQERERIAQLFDSSHIATDGDSMHNQSGNCPACWGLALIKGEQK
jgi:hypothetical protein